MKHPIYYVTERDLWDDTMELYSTGEFPDRLANNVLKMTNRIVGARRWDSCPPLLKEEMVSGASSHACLKLMQKKFNPKKGSRVYSWLSRVIINACLQIVIKYNSDKKKFQKYAGEFALLNPVESHRKYEIDDN